MRIAHINVLASLSTGRIAVDLCRMAMDKGHRALLCHARDHAPADVPSYRIGTLAGVYTHIGLARLTDRSGFFSRHATRALVRQLEGYKPDIVHLHNLHGYYLHLPTLFHYLKDSGVMVVWTLHDCWAFTGHCAYFTIARNAPPLHAGPRRRAKQTAYGCDRWQGGCGKCRLKRLYPASWLLDQSARNWREKRDLFTSLERMVLVTPSEWMLHQIERSFLKRYPAYALPNGLDLDVFRACADEGYFSHVMEFYKLERFGGRPIVLSVAAVWEERKGLYDLIELAELLGEDYCVMVVGLDQYQIEALPPKTVYGYRRTANVRDLCALYTLAQVYVSASHEESMGMTLLEAMACGTQVLCYNATAMPELVIPAVGRVVPIRDVEAMAQAVREMCAQPLAAADCRAHAEQYDISERYRAYMRLYENMYRQGAPQPAPKEPPREPRRKYRLSKRLRRP